MISDLPTYNIAQVLCSIYLPSIPGFPLYSSLPNILEIKIVQRHYTHCYCQPKLFSFFSFCTRSTMQKSRKLCSEVPQHTPSPPPPLPSPSLPFQPPLSFGGKLEIGIFQRHCLLPFPNNLKILTCSHSLGEVFQIHEFHTIS